MPTQWDEFEAVEEPKSQVDWNEFEPAPVSQIKLSPYQQAELESLQAGRGKPETGMEPGTEFTKSLFVHLPRDIGTVLHKTGKGVGTSFKAAAFDILGEPELREQQLGTTKEELIKRGANPIGLSETGEDPWAQGTEMLPTVPRVAAKTAAGFIETAPQLAISAVNPALGALSFGFTPEGFDPITAGAMLALPGVGKYTGRIAELAAERIGIPIGAATGLIEKIGGASGVAGLISADQYRHIASLPEQERQKAFEDASGTALAIFAMSMAHRAPSERSIFLGESAEKPSATEAALRLQSPEVAQIQIPGRETPGNIVRLPSGVPIEAPSVTKETARQAAIRQFNQRLSEIKFKAPKPTVPEGPEPGMELATQPTSGMREIKEPASYDEFVSDLTSKVTPDMTVKQVQEMYPKAFKRGENIINKEAAGELLSDAKKQAHPIDWLEQEMESGKKVGTGNAYEVGLRVRTVEDLERLAQLREKLAKKSAEAIAAKNINKAVAIGTSMQLPVEAIEAATFIGGKKHPGLPENRPLDVRSFPEVREWLRKNANRFGEGYANVWLEQLGKKPATEAAPAEAPKPEVKPEAPAPAAQPAPGGFIGLSREKWTLPYLEGLGATGRAPVIRQAIAALKDVGGKTKLGENATPQTLLKAVNEIMDLREKKKAEAPKPAAEKTVPVYHGEGGAEGAGLGGFSVSESQKYAASFGPRQSVVEVPESVLEKMKEDARNRGEPSNLILPEEYQKQLKPVEKPIESPTTETSFITKESIEAGKGKLTPNEIDELGRLLTAEEFEMLDAAQSKRLAELRQKTETSQTPEPVPMPETAPVGVPPAIPEPTAAKPAPVETKPVTPEVSEAETAELMPAGPGAASPVEFAERQIKAGSPPPEPPKDTNPGVPIDGSEPPTPEIVRKANDFNILNRFNSGQWSFYFGKLGEAAKAAWERMAIGEFRMRESIQRDVQNLVDVPLKTLPKELRKEGGKAFFDILNGRKLEAIEEEWAGRPGGNIVIDQARKVKTRLEEIRTTIRDIKRESYHSYLMGMKQEMLERLYEQNIFKDTQGKQKEALADALTLDQFPDDWGIADGSYLPHLFFGQWKVSASLPGGEQPLFITRAKTPAEAKARIYELTQNNPEYRDAQFTIEQDMVMPADMIRLGDGSFWRLIAQMKEQAQGNIDPKEAVQGIIGRKASKQKWFGSLQKRQGFEGYSKDYKQVMTAYLNGFQRWKELTAMNREVQPLIEQVKREGRLNAAGRLTDIMDILWGKPSQMTLDFDAFLRDIPVIRDIVKPLALDRWARFINSTVTNLMLRTIRFGVVNRLQPLQGLYPLIGERLMIEAKILQHSPEGRRLLDEAGVNFDPGQYAGEYSGGSKFKRFVERISGEKPNQEYAFLGMYLHGREQGMSHSQAIHYGKIRGQLMTQFSPLIVDVPPIMEGPLGRVTFQFKRFPVKQIELLARMAADRNLPALTRYFAVMAASGGLALMLKQVYADKEKRLRAKRSLDKSLGEKGSDFVFYGLPGLIGADLSGSLVLGDEPYGENLYEKLGRTVLGPAPSMTYEIGKSVAGTAREPINATDKTLAISRKIPSLRQIVELTDLIRGNLDVTTPDGEIKYRRKLRDVILGLGSFRSANEANIQTAVSAIIELKKEVQTLKNDLWLASRSRDQEKVSAARQAIKDYNHRWPEAAITPEEIERYFSSRKGYQPKTDVERAVGNKYRALMPAQ